MPKLKNDKHETKDCNQILNNCIHELENMTPASWFTYNSVSDDEFKECWSLDNLQPLEKMHNIAKSNNYAG
jgi:hypothetical protein